MFGHPFFIARNTVTLRTIEYEPDIMNGPGGAIPNVGVATIRAFHYAGAFAALGKFTINFPPSF